MRKTMKVFLSVMIVVALLATSVFSVFADHKEKGNGYGNIGKQFKDVEEDFWAYDAIQMLTEMGVINGFSDKTFKPNSSVTRSQFATMLSKALDLTTTSNTQTFADVPTTSWDYKVVEASKNYLTGYRTSSGILYFYGSRNSVREDMAVALVKALKITLVSDSGQLQQIFSDYDEISPSLRDYVYTAYKEGLMVGSGGKFKPQGNLTRAEAAILLLKALQKTDKVPVDDGDKVPIDNSNGTTDASLINLRYNGATVTSFAQNTLTYNVILPAGTTAIPVVSATVNATGKATAAVTQAISLPGTAIVVVTAEDGVTHKTYIINFTVAATNHNDATLSNLSVNGVTVTGFAPGKLSYNMILPVGTSATPVVTANVTDTGNATANIVQATNLPGTAIVVVTAENGITHKTYIINFTVAVAENTDATLSNLSVNGVTVTGFAPGKLTYNMILPAGTTALPVVAANVTDTGKATANIVQATNLPGTAIVVVTAENGITHKTYIINFTVEVKHTDATLGNLLINGVTVTGFAPATLTYNVVLAAGTTAIPVVTATVNDTGRATATVTQATSLPGTAIVGVTAEDGITHKTYIVNFTVAASAKHTDATLSSLSIDGVALTGFVPGTLIYDLVLPAGTTEFPVVTVTVNDTGKATATVTQATVLSKQATVVVTAEDGTTQKIYKINFIVAV